jgi:RHS repeat-associated protein
MNGVLVDRPLASERGNRTTATGANAMTMAYNGADQVTSVTKAGVTSTYTFDGNGLRASKTVGTGSASAQVWDTVSFGLPVLIAEGANRLVHGPGGQPIAQINGSTATCLHGDQLGSVRVWTDAAGAVSGSATYGLFGNVTSQTGTASSSVMGHAGQQRDAETGFMYLRARFMDPATGLFLTRDPIEAITGLAYGYTPGDPVNYKDPSGLWGWSDTLAAVSIATGVVGTVAAFFPPAAPIAGPLLVVSWAAGAGATALDCRADPTSFKCATGAAATLAGPASFGLRTAARFGRIGAESARMINFGIDGTVGWPLMAIGAGILICENT